MGPLHCVKLDAPRSERWGPGINCESAGLVDCQRFGHGVDVEMQAASDGSHYAGRRTGLCSAGLYLETERKIATSA